MLLIGCTQKKDQDVFFVGVERCAKHCLSVGHEFSKYQGEILHCECGNKIEPCKGDKK